MTTIGYIQWITPAALEDPQIVESIQRLEMYRALRAMAERRGGRVVGDWDAITSSILSAEDLTLHGLPVHPQGAVAWCAEIPMEVDERAG